MSMPARSSSLSGSSRSGVSRGDFPPRPKSVRIWAVNESADVCPTSSTPDSRRAGTEASRGWRAVAAVFTAFCAIAAIVAMARLLRHQLGE